MTQILFELAKKNPLALESPEPELLFDEFGQLGMNFKFVLWAKQESFFDLKKKFPCEIQQAFKENSIYIPVIQNILMQK